MNSPLDEFRIKKNILEMFRLGCDPVAAAQPLSDDELERMLDAIRLAIPFRKPAQNQALSQFLFAGARRFDRWSAPSPFVVPTAHAARFEKFVDALWRAERRDPTNCAVFQIHLIRDELFRRMDGAPISDVSHAVVRQFRERVGRVTAPSIPVKLTEFEQQKAEILALIEGLTDESLRTVIRFRIPYVMHKQSIDLGLRWRGIRIRVLVVPQFRPPDETFLVPGGGQALSVGASRWQTGTSQITIKMDTLLDGSAYAERLQALPGHAPPVDGWPKSFSWAFSIFHDFAWQLREKHGGHQDWVPAPRDLSDLEFYIQTSTCERLGYIRKGSPAALWEFFGASSDVVAIELGDIEPLSWSTECQARARMYLELGETNETLFWLNVAAESLVAQRFNEIEQVTGIAGLAEDLGSPKEFWAQAEEILRKQYAEMANKVKWPTASVHVSVFGKLKALYRRVKMKTSVDDLLRRYRDISGDRNDLFHGKRAGRVSVAAVMTAFEALEWINENMWPEKQVSGEES